jgi:hypothetical protein
VVRVTPSFGAREATFSALSRSTGPLTLPYTVARGIEDIEALVDEAGGSAYLYEPPFIIDDSRLPLPADNVELSRFNSRI